MEIGKTVMVTDEDNREFEANVLTTYSANGKNYLLAEDPETEEVFAFWYTDDGDLFSVETDEEYDLAEEKLNEL